MFRLFGLLVFINTSLALDVLQPSLLTRVQLGDSVTLTCFYPEDVSYVAWFKQAVGQKPQLMAKRDGYLSGEFYSEFKNIKRYSLQNAKGSFNLTISNMEPSDSAVYYCIAWFYRDISFGNGTFVIITGKDSNSRTVVQQPVPDTVQPGDSVSLRCTIETGSCAGEHSVYWFRHGSGESLPGVIYSHRNRSDECEKSPEAGSPTRSCVYSLPKGNLSLSDAGTYYCAVAMCGEMLFGNGTKLDIDGWYKLLDPLHSGLLIVLSCSIILNVALICITCKLTCTHCADEKNSDISKAEWSREQCHDEDTLNYAALNLKKPKPRRQKKDGNNDTLYSDLRYRDYE
ncbi:V-set and immunoglobulin domain-containing protein 1-like [Brienomyrus brachyistius]|uniref:V-set and immunoglobulin domain-containing protein 1-like n=1 Tax=Brienomyrus brachyistius TaxID=42636 RepID=UPI0020B277D2|nr:V-set and immunoglobulin domain-containing protein 1-like [Brienomyrus brachyistius]